VKEKIYQYIVLTIS